MREFFYFLVDIWAVQAVILMGWSLACFLLGMAFCASLYAYRIKRAMRLAAKKVEELAQTTPMEHNNDRRYNDTEDTK
jgi:hypothetical protein